MRARVPPSVPRRKTAGSSSLARSHALQAASHARPPTRRCWLPFRHTEKISPRRLTVICSDGIAARRQRHSLARLAAASGAPEAERKQIPPPTQTRTPARIAQEKRQRMMPQRNAEERRARHGSDPPRKIQQAHNAGAARFRAGEIRRRHDESVAQPVERNGDQRDPMRRRIQQRQSNSGEHVSDDESRPIAAPGGQSSRDPDSRKGRCELHREKQSRLRIAQIPSRDKRRQRSARR